ncbi:MAG: agmatinase family protein [Nitrososphaerales archaeon]|nr:agmatinase family protein [Nitrososphaerales archaeon]
MRKPVSYPTPSYTDPRDRRVVSMVRKADRASPRAVNLLGVPFDGAVLGRKGAAEGPSAIRRAMRFFSNYNPEFGFDLLKARIVDLGDVVVRSPDVRKVHADVENEVGGALSKSSLLVVLGGDNSVSLPSITACSEKFGKVGLVVFDSHYDLREPMNGRPTSGSSYGTAVRTLEGLDGSRLVEIGIHGFLNSRSYADEARRLGTTIFTAKGVREAGTLAVARKAYGIASRGADVVYVSVDMDCVDVSSVSGVSAPSAGGIDARELFEMLYFLGTGRKVVCADIVELAPPLDPTGKSEVVAATALVYMIAGYTARSGRPS